MAPPVLHQTCGGRFIKFCVIDDAFGHTHSFFQCDKCSAVKHIQDHDETTAWFYRLGKELKG